MKKILVMTSHNTGSGHKSVSEALCEKLSGYDEIEVRAVNGFSLMGTLQQRMAENSYGPITRLPGRFWELNYAVGEFLRWPVTVSVTAMIQKKFLNLLKEFRPDLIVSTHPMFQSSVLDILAKERLSIPFVAHEVDLIDMPDYWFDRRTDLFLAPTEEAYRYTIEHGIPEEKVVRVCFPVRKRFLTVSAPEFHEGKVITVMSGAEASGRIEPLVRELLEHTDARINVVCARNRHLYLRLKKSLQTVYPQRLNLLEYVDNIQVVMLGSDLLVMRASPNSVMEAIHLNIPIILFGKMAGQEIHNPEMLEAHALAKYMPDMNLLSDIVRMYLENDGKVADAMKEAQRKYLVEDTAQDSAELLRAMLLDEKT